MRLYVALYATAAAIFVPAGSVGAQVASTPQAAQAERPEASDALADIVVTAQRRSENLQQVPIAVTALTGGQLAASGIGATSDLARLTPSLVVSNNAGIVRPSLRGITNTAAGAGLENSVATYLDGVYIASIPTSLIDLAGVERVEVLRGPQGTLFGRNATGGLIQVITKDPGTSFEGAAHLGYGNYQTLTGDFYIAGPVAPGVGASLAFNGTRQGEGYGINIATGNDTNKLKHNIVVRSKWLFELGDTTKARLSLDYANKKGSLPAAGNLVGRPILYGPTRNVNPWDIDISVDMEHRIKNGGASLTVDQELGSLNLTSITSYRGMNFFQFVDFDAGPQPAITGQYLNIQRQLSQELRLGSSKGPLKWVVGAYYFSANDKFAPYQTIFGPPLAVRRTVIDSRITTRSLAGFAQGSYETDGGTELTVGLRYTTEKRGITGQVENFNAAGVSQGLAYPAVDSSKRFNKLTWRLALSQKLSDRTLAYVSYNRGFKSGSFNGQAPILSAFNPEVLDAYEAGVKTELFDRHLRINTAGFYYSFKDIQVNTFLAGTSRIYNGAKAELYGLDLEVTAVPTDRLTLTATLGLLHDRFTSFPSAVIGMLQPNGSNILAPGSAKGNRLPFAADFTASLGAHYEIPVGPGKVAFNVDYLFNDGFFTEPDNVLHAPSYNLLSSSVVWTSDSGYSVAIWGRNLTNAAATTALITTPTTTFASYQPPRTYGVTLGVKF